MRPTTNLRQLWQWLAAPSDETLADAARDGELLVARVRTWLTMLLLLIPAVALSLQPGEAQHWVGFAVAVVAVIGSLSLDRAVRRGLYRPGLSVVTTLADVTIVTMALAAFWLIGAPIITTNSRVIFEAYFLAIAAASLRYSPRICWLAGTAAILQYLTLSVLTWRFASEESLAVGMGSYGTLDWTTQFARMIMLLAATVLATSVVSRAVRLRRLSTSDRLTGLFNRAYIEEFLGHELVRAVREAVPVALAILDVDHFKRFNDTHGHAAGDAALRTTAQVLRTGLRRSDVVARFGGEEILIAMPNTTLRSAMEKLDDLRVRVGLTEIPLPRGGTARLTVSMGVAALELDGSDLAELLDAADARLYAAKAAGRNRIFGPSDMPAATMQDAG
ncbi:MAG TPA: GGDEF domain-containing protein [Gemmatimonadales bacterium]|nr:GGDEF domain-containing protein [Gemmatimonadales bacterium]